jgi:hypothetical protein
LARTRRRRSRTPEGVVLHAVLELFRLHGWPAWRFNSGSLRDKDGRPVRFILGSDGRPYSGFSDVGALAPGGRWVAVEAKRPGGKATALQLAHLDRVEAAGGVALLVDDVLTLQRAILTLTVDPRARLSRDGRALPPEDLPPE